MPKTMVDILVEREITTKDRAEFIILQGNLHQLEQLIDDDCHSVILECVECFLRCGADFNYQAKLFAQLVCDTVEEAMHQKRILTLLESIHANPDGEYELFRIGLSHYDQLFDNENGITELENAFTCLIELGATPKLHCDHFNKVFLYVNNAANITKILRYLEQEGANINEHSELYLVAIESIEHYDQLSMVYSILKNQGITISKHTKIYIAATEYVNTKTTTYLPPLIRVLNNHGACIHMHQRLYASAIKSVQTAHDQMSKGFYELKKLGATIDNHEALFHQMIDRKGYLNDQLMIFPLLQQLGITANHHDIILNVIEASAYPLRLYGALGILCNMELTAETHLSIIAAVIEKYNHIYKLPALIESLISIKASLKKHINLSLVFIDNIQFVDSFSKSLLILIKLGATLDKHEIIFREAITMSAVSEHIPEALSVLGNLGATIADHEDLIRKMLAMAYHARPMTATLLQLKKLNASMEQHADLIRKLIHRERPYNKLPYSLSALKDKGATLDSNATLFDAAIEYHKDEIDTSEVFHALTESGFTIDNHPSMFISAMKAYIQHPFELIGLFIQLKKRGVTFEKQPALFELMLNQSGISDSVDEVFNILDDININPTKHANIVEAAITEAIAIAGMKTFVRIMMNTLIQCGATPSSDSDLFISLIIHARAAANTLIAVRDLKAASATITKHKALFTTVIENQDVADHTSQIIYIFSIFDINIDKLNELLTANTINLLNINELLCIAYDRLCKVGLKNSNHPSLYKCILNTALSSTMPEYDVLKIIDVTCDFVINNNYNLRNANSDDLTVFNQQLNDVILNIPSPQDGISQGPLSLSTQIIEVKKIIQILIDTDIDKIKAYYDTTAGFIIEVEDKTLVPLSLMIHHANFSHLFLSDSEVTRVTNKLKTLLESQWKIYHKNSLIQLLYTHDQQVALSLYVTDQFKNINLLYRGDKLVCAPRHCFFKYENDDDANDTKNIVTCFLLGCLINDALNKLPILAWNREEAIILNKVIAWWTNLPKNKKPHHLVKFTTEHDIVNEWLTLKEVINISHEANIISNHEYHMLSTSPISFSIANGLWSKTDLAYRYETLSEENQKRRMANPWTLPSLTSICMLKSGASAFASQTNTKSIIHNSPHSLIINHQNNENEVILPHGLQMISIIASDHIMHSYIVNNPDFIEDHYQSSLSIFHAYRDYLSQPYKDKSENLSLNHAIISRPNHGLAHTYRVMLLTDTVIEYYARHANDDAFKHYCQNLSPSDKELLRIAAAFRVTGRESETSVHENLKRYNEYKEASEQHFQRYIEPKLFGNSKQHHQKRVKQLAHVIRYLGNPYYETSADDTPIINNHPDDNERNERNYLHRLLMTAHNLDLPRCYSFNEFHQAMQCCIDLSKESRSQQQDYQAMINYSISLIRAHGDRLLFQSAQTNNNFLANRQTYQPIFKDASTSLKRVRELSLTVQKPHFQRRSPNNIVNSVSTDKSEFKISIATTSLWHSTSNTNSKSIASAPPSEKLGNH